MSNTHKECIIVLGMHRSGTSVLTGVLSILGGDVGSDIMPPTEDNPKGYFENNYIYHLNRKILHEAGADWGTARFEFEEISESNKKAYIKEAKEILKKEFKYVRQIVIKDPRVCFLFPIWEEALSDLGISIKVILPVRSPVEVARSLQKRNSFTIEQGINLWASHILHAEKFSRSYERMSIIYPDDFHHIDKLVEGISKLCGFEPSDREVEEVKAFYSSSLTHHQFGFKNTNSLPHSLQKLILLLQEKNTSADDFDEIKKQYLAEEEFYSQSYKEREKSNLLDIAALKKERDEVLTKCRKLEVEKAELLEKNKVLKRKHGDSDQLCQLLGEEKTALGKINQELKKSNQELNSDKKELKRAQQAFEQSVNKVQAVSQQHLNEKQSFIARLKSDISKLLSKIDRVERDYHKLREDRDRKNLLISDKNTLVAYLSNRLKNSDELLFDISNDPKQAKKITRYLSDKSMASRYQKKWYFPFVRKPLATQRKRLIAESGLFSSIYYCTTYPDVRKSGMMPLEHFYKYGWKEERRPSEGFDLKGYLKAYPDVANSGINPLFHYLVHGVNEGRSPLPEVEVKNPVKKNLSQSFSKGSSPNSAVEKDDSKYQILPYKNNYGPVIDRKWGQKLKIINELAGCDRCPDMHIPKAVVDDVKEQIKSVDAPLVSIVMPCWNRGDVIQAAIDSVLKQSYQNFELIISDDGSTDETLSFIKTKYLSLIESKKIKLIENQHNGVCATRNAGLGLVSGELIAYLDSDNQWREHYLLLMVSAFLENDEVNCAYSALLLNDNNKQTKRILSREFDRKQLLTSNFIDLNVFMHRATLYKQYGGFDGTLTRLVDWELIIRYSRFYEPAHLPFIGVDYFLDHDKFNNITTTVGLDDNRNNVNKRHFFERIRYGLDSVRLAYVLWDFPALSQTFVINELRWLVENDYDVNVYFAVEPDKAAVLDFEVNAYKTSTAEELVVLLQEHNRSLCHSHFAYPAVTKLTWPACEELKLPFTFMPHAVDIFHHDNQKRNNIGEISSSYLCRKVFVHGPYHKNFLESKGVPSEKMAYNFQAVNLSDFLSSDRLSTTVTDAESPSPKKHRGIVLSRFVEKKGISSLIDAAALLRKDSVYFELYGYGPLEAEYREGIAKKGLTNIKLMGALESKEDIRELYSKSDFLIAPCVEAQNGDRDGFPTVILEAFSMGVPVITTNIAAVPDYITDEVQALIATAGDAKSLARKVKQLVHMPKNRLQALTRQAQGFLKTKVGTGLSMSLLTDEWFDKRIDIFLVSFNNEEYNDEEETLEIIRRVFAYTTTPFTLTIVDNNSDESFWLNILESVKGRSNVRLIRKKKNLMCGPSSNIALEMGDAEYAIYICAKEGFIGQHGWERTLLNAMREKPNAALGGHHAHMPKYVYGSEYETHPEFSKFRNKDFLTGRLDKPFTHIQGGVFIIRREVFAKHGGFNSLIPHGGMDVELSYFYESLGYELLKIPEVASLTVKTRPTLTSMVDENTVIAHPLTMESVSNQFDRLFSQKVKQCNVCGWQGERFAKTICPQCGSSSEARLVYQYLSSNYRTHRKSNALLLGQDKSLAKSLSSLFLVTEEPQKSVKYSCIILLDHSAFEKTIYTMLDDDGVLIIVDDGLIQYDELPSPHSFYNRDSTVLEYGWKRLVLIEKRVIN